MYCHLFHCFRGLNVVNRCQYFTRFYVQSIPLYKLLDDKFSFKRNFFPKELIDNFLADEIYLTFHYTGVVCNNYDTVKKYENFGVLFYESVNCPCALYKLYLEIFTRVLLNSLNRKTLPIFITGKIDKA